MAVASLRAEMLMRSHQQLDLRLTAAQKRLGQTSHLSALERDLRERAARARKVVPVHKLDVAAAAAGRRCALEMRRAAATGPGKQLPPRTRSVCVCVKAI